MTDPIEEAEIGLDEALVDHLDRVSPMQTSTRSTSFRSRRWDEPAENLKATEGAISDAGSLSVHLSVVCKVLRVGECTILG